MLKLPLLIVLSFIGLSAYSQSFNISGYVEDANTGERIIGAYITDSISKNVTQTNNFGFFTFKSISNKAVVHASYMGSKSDTRHVFLSHDTLITIGVNLVNEIKEIQVVSSQYKRNANNNLGMVTIPTSQLSKVPSLGETDLIKSIQSQAGVKGGIEGSAGVFVRGGNGGENLFMLDEVPLYNISHLYGFFSVFNSSAIKDIKLLTGCFPSRYGGRASSVVDVHSRDGNNKSIKGELSIGFVSSKFSLEGPLLSDKTTFIVSGRRSYFDLYSNSLKKVKALDEDFPDYFFYDFNARVAHTFSKKDKLFISIYKGKDYIQNKDESSVSSNASEENPENQGIRTDDMRDESSGWGETW